MIVRSRAPLRLGLAGGGTDLSPYSDIYGGNVLNATIDMYSYCTIEPSDNGFIEIIAPDAKETFYTESLSKLPLCGNLLLHKAVYNRIVSDFLYGKPLSFKMTTYSDAPIGSGLGSSSTMVVALITGFAEWLNLPLGEYDIARLAYEIEREDIGLSGGKQDQYAATFGGFNFIEFYDKGRVVVNPLRIKNWIKNEFQNSLILLYTGVSRQSAKIIDQQIDGVKTNDEFGIKNMHALKENAVKMKEALLKGDLSNVSVLLKEGWNAKKGTSKVVTNEHIEQIYRLIMSHGGVAAKISGAGGGGYMMILCDPLKRYELIEVLTTTGGRVATPGFANTGSEAWTIR
jgi:D-glycero-alpha-D-manno-heptose-7-phosphate kinase